MMRKIAFLSLLLALFFTIHSWANELTGFWQTMDKETNRPSSVIAVYTYQGKYYGRIIGTFNKDGELDDTIYNPQSRAPGLPGNPHYSGLDIVWNGTPASNGRYKGYVVDPRDGKVYDAELWTQNGNLILRGEVFIFGRNVVWPPFPEENFTKKFKKPDLKTFIPKIPTVSY